VPSMGSFVNSGSVMAVIISRKNHARSLPERAWL
jgi:hypothetical protein